MACFQEKTGLIRGKMKLYIFPLLSLNPKKYLIALIEKFYDRDSAK